MVERYKNKETIEKAARIYVSYNLIKTFSTTLPQYDLDLQGYIIEEMTIHANNILGELPECVEDITIGCITTRRDVPENLELHAQSWDDKQIMNYYLSLIPS